MYYGAATFSAGHLLKNPRLSNVVADPNFRAEYHGYLSTKRSLCVSFCDRVNGDGSLTWNAKILMSRNMTRRILSLIPSLNLSRSPSLNRMTGMH